MLHGAGNLPTWLGHVWCKWWQIYGKLPHAWMHGASWHYYLDRGMSNHEQKMIVTAEVRNKPEFRHNICVWDVSRIYNIRNIK
jgi:hypothetical protein